MFSAGTKRLLKNFILHTGTHNRIVEENEMWRQHSKTKESNFGESKKNAFLDDKRDDMNDAKYNMKRCSAHMDESNDKTSTYWARQLQKSEEADPERWGHSGFKELYPKDFDSDRSVDDSSSSSSSSSSDHRRKRRKRKKKLKEMEEKARKRKKTAKKYKQKHMSDSESDSERRKKVKKKRHRKDKIDFDSDSEDNVPRKRLKESSSKRKSKNSSQHKKRSKKHKHKKHSASSD